MDPKRQRRVAAILVGVAALIWVWGLMAKRPHPKTAASSISLEHRAPNVPGPTGAGKHPIPRMRVSRYTDWGGNPFEMERHTPAPTPASTSAAAPLSYVVSGILWDAQTPSAVVNGRLVGPGDDLGGWKVIEIQKTHVILSDGTTTQTLKVE